jgi:hypothetical protein
MMHRMHKSLSDRDYGIYVKQGETSWDVSTFVRQGSGTSWKVSTQGDSFNVGVGMTMWNQPLVVRQY